jgi:hypothetical protein
MFILPGHAAKRIARSFVIDDGRTFTDRYYKTPPVLRHAARR